MGKGKKETAIEKFLKNAYWKELYENAPGNAQKYYEYLFMKSDGALEDSEREGIIIPIFKSMTSTEWDYVIENTLNKMGKWGLKKAREKYGKGVA